MICLFIVTDLGRLLYLKNQARITADAVALAAAGAVDMRHTLAGESCQINQAWAAARASQVMTEMGGKVGEDAWMQIRIALLEVDGCEVTVVIDGTGSTLFGSYLGLQQFQTRAVAHAEAALTLPAGGP